MAHAIRDHSNMSWLRICNQSKLPTTIIEATSYILAYRII